MWVCVFIFLKDHPYHLTLKTMTTPLLVSCGCTCMKCGPCVIRIGTFPCTSVRLCYGEDRKAIKRQKREPNCIQNTRKDKPYQKETVEMKNTKLLTTEQKRKGSMTTHDKKTRLNLFTPCLEYPHSIPPSISFSSFPPRTSFHPAPLRVCERERKKKIIPLCTCFLSFLL